jgi:hypothetical protein
MSAITILPHHIAASLLSLYAGLAIVFTDRKPPQSVPEKPLTYLDVDLQCCTDEELLYVLALVLTQAQTLTLTEDETARFRAVCRELGRRPVPRKEN